MHKYLQLSQDISGTLGKFLDWVYFCHSPDDVTYPHVAFG